MKNLLLPCLLLASTSAFGQLLTTPAPADPRLTDYAAWFAGFKVASDDTVYGQPSPINSTPAAENTALRTWSGWTQNWSPGLTGPITNVDDQYTLKVEYVFLGETAGWWDDWGYRRTTPNLEAPPTVTEDLIADGVQALAPANRWFGDYGYFNLAPGETLDFFVNGTQTTIAGDGDNPGGLDGGRYYVFDRSLNVPISSSMQSYFGNLTPKTSPGLRDPKVALPGEAFTIVGFEDIRLGANWQDGDFNDFIFAFRAVLDIPQGPVPEPSTYGLIGAAALLALAGLRRFRKA